MAEDDSRDDASPDDEQNLPAWARDADIDTPDEMAEDGQGQAGAGGASPSRQHKGPPPEVER